MIRFFRCWFSKHRFGGIQPGAQVYEYEAGVVMTTYPFVECSRCGKVVYIKKHD